MCKFLFQSTQLHRKNSLHHFSNTHFSGNKFNTNGIVPLSAFIINLIHEHQTKRSRSDRI